MLGISRVGALPMALVQGSHQDVPMAWTTTGVGGPTSILRQSSRSSQHLCPQDDRSSLLNPTLNIHGCSGVPAHLPPSSPSCSPACGYTGLPCYICSTDHAQHYHAASAPLIILGDTEEEEVIGTTASHTNNQSPSQQFQAIQNVIQNSSLIQSPSQPPPPTILDPRNLYLDNSNQIKYFTTQASSMNPPSNIPYHQYPFSTISNFNPDGVQDDNHSHVGREEHHQSTSNLVPDHPAVLQHDRNGNDSKVFLFEFLSLAVMVVAIPLFLVLVFIIYIL